MLNSTSGSGRRLAAVMLLGASSAASAALAAASAHADGGVIHATLGATEYQSTVHMTDTVQDTKLYSLIPDGGKTPLWTYCIQEGVGQTSTTYSEGSWDSKTVQISTENLKAIKWVINNSFPTVDETTLAKAAGIKDGLTKNEAVAGTQAAIWSFSGSAKLDIAKQDTSDPNIELLYSYLLKNVTGTLADGPASLGLTPLQPGVEHHAGDRIGYQVLSSNTTESFISFHLGEGSPDGAKLVDADGKDIAPGTLFKSGAKIYVQLPPVLTKDGKVSLEADGTATSVEAGRVFLPDTGTSQNLILAQTAKAPVKATVDVSWLGTVVTPPSSSSSHTTTPPPTTQPSTTQPTTSPTTTRTTVAAAATHATTTTTPAATTTTTSDTDDLAHTGAGNSLTLGGGALALVAAGGGMVVYARRRKQAPQGTHS